MPENNDEMNPWDKDYWIGRGRDHAARGWVPLARVEGGCAVGLMQFPSHWSPADRVRAATWYGQGHAAYLPPTAVAVAAPPVAGIVPPADARWRKCQHVSGARRPGVHAIRPAGASTVENPRWDVVHLDDPDGAYLDLPDDCATGFKISEPFPDSIQIALDARARRAETRNAAMRGDG